MSLWYVGAILAVLGSVGSNLGINIQKYSFLQNNKKPKDQQRPYTKQPGWALGLVLVILGSVGDFAALALAAQSIVAPIGSVTLVANIVFAHFWLKESLSRRDFIGTVLIIGGSVVTVAFGDHNSPKYSLDEFLDFFGKTSCYAYAIILTALCVVLYTVVRIAQPMKLQLVAYEESFALIKSDSERAATRDADVEYKALEARYCKFKRILPFSYCCLSGVLGAQSILFGKLVSGLLSTTFQGDNQLVSPFPYVFAFCMLAFILAQLHFLALALQLFDALYCVPMFQCFWIITSTVGGAAFFQEFTHFTTQQFVLFPLGIVICLSGIGLLAQRDTSSISPSAYSGGRVVPASTATFFLDLAIEKTQGISKLKRSLSHNSLPGADTGKSKVQLEKAAVENEAQAAAILTLSGGMRLPDHVEQSVREISMNQESSYMHSSLNSPHLPAKRGNTISTSMNPSRQSTRLKKQPSHHQRAESTQPGHVAHMEPPTPTRDSVSISIDSEMRRTRRKAKTRSHPTHWPQGSNAESIAASLAPQPLVTRAETSSGFPCNRLSPSSRSTCDSSFSNTREALDIPMTTLDRSRSEDLEGTDKSRCRVPSARLNKHNAAKLGALTPLTGANHSLPCHQEECEESISTLTLEQSSKHHSTNHSSKQNVDPAGPLLGHGEKHIAPFYSSSASNSLPPLRDVSNKETQEEENTASTVV